jgi:hypothetical protein
MEHFLMYRETKTLPDMQVFMSHVKGDEAYLIPNTDSDFVACNSDRQTTEAAADIKSILMYIAYMHSDNRLHGIVRNFLSTGTFPNMHIKNIT